MAAAVDIPGLEDPVEVGRGAFGVVYRARQAEFDREVAVKVLTSALEDETSRSRFDRECRALGSLSGHPNIVTVYAAGLLDDGRPYLVMELLPGGTLAERLARDGRLPWREVVDTGLSLSGGLAAAHAAGVLHRDIKPANVLLSRWDEPKLADFGIARIAGGHETRSAQVTASIAYAPPEVLAGTRPEPSADVYSLAATLHTLLAGRPAFLNDDDESLLAVIARVGTEPPPDLRRLGVPPPVAEVVAAGMAKEPSRRLGDAEGFGRALRTAADRAGLQTPAPVTDVDPALRTRVRPGPPRGSAPGPGGPAPAGPRPEGRVPPGPRPGGPRPGGPRPGGPGAPRPGGPPGTGAGAPATTSGPVPPGAGRPPGAPRPGTASGPVPVRAGGAPAGGGNGLKVLAGVLGAVLLVLVGVLAVAALGGGGDDGPSADPSSDVPSTRAELAALVAVDDDDLPSFDVGGGGQSFADTYLCNTPTGLPDDVVQEGVDGLLPDDGFTNVEVTGLSFADATAATRWVGRVEGAWSCPEYQFQPDGDVPPVVTAVQQVADGGQTEESPTWDVVFTQAERDDTPARVTVLREGSLISVVTLAAQDVETRDRLWPEVRDGAVGALQEAAVAAG